MDEAQKVIDPICGMTVEPNFSAGKLDYEGQTYYFCTNALRLNKLKLQAELFMVVDLTFRSITCLALLGVTSILPTGYFSRRPM